MYEVFTVRLLGLVFFGTVLLTSVNGQATNTGSTTKPADVFLDNHRPLVKKKDKAPTSRDVAGKVVDSTGQPLEGALVTITNLRTNAKINFFTKADGRYYFEDLSLTVDYELQAKWKAHLTELRKVSQYDPNTSTVRILQIDTSAPTASAGQKDSGNKKQDAPPR